MVIDFGLDIDFDPEMITKHASCIHEVDSYYVEGDIEVTPDLAKSQHKRIIGAYSKHGTGIIGVYTEKHKKKHLTRHILLFEMYNAYLCQSTNECQLIGSKFQEWKSNKLIIVQKEKSKSLSDHDHVADFSAKEGKLGVSLRAFAGLFIASSHELAKDINEKMKDSLRRKRRVFRPRN